MSTHDTTIIMSISVEMHRAHQKCVLLKSANIDFLSTWHSGIQDILYVVKTQLPNTMIKLHTLCDILRSKDDYNELYAICLHNSCTKCFLIGNLLIRSVLRTCAECCTKKLGQKKCPPVCPCVL